MSDLAGGEVRYDALTLHFFPWPRVEIRNATVRIPGAVAGQIGTLTIRIALLPLLAGNVQPVAVNVGQPVLQLTVQPRRRWRSPPRCVPHRARLGRPCAGAARARDVVRDTDGKLDVLHAGRRILSLSGLAVDARVAADAIHADASGSADLWRTASLRLKIVPASLMVTSQAPGGRPAPRGGAAGGRSPERGARARGIDADPSTPKQMVARACGRG